MGNNEIFLMPWGKHVFDIARNEHQPFLENLIDIKTSISNTTYFYHHDLVNMAKFILNYKKDKSAYDMVFGIILHSFKSVLDHIIDENMENQPTPKSKVTNLFPTMEEDLDLLNKRLTEIEWKRSKIFSSEPIKKKSKSHLRVMK